MSTQNTAAQQAGLIPWKPGQSGNPGGMPKGVRALQAKILLAHGEQVIPALQRLLDIGMDESVPAKVRVAALTAYVGKVGDLTGVANLGKQAKSAEEGEEGELTEAGFWAKILASPQVRATVLSVIQGGKP